MRPTLSEFAGGEPAFPCPDAAVPAGLAMPRWSWDGLQAGAPSP